MSNAFIGGNERSTKEVQGDLHTICQVRDGMFEGAASSRGEALTELSLPIG
jgi:hypothetical protein